MKLVVLHTSSTQRRVVIDVPDENHDDPEQFLYENVEETDGEIVGGGWSIDSFEEAA